MFCILFQGFYILKYLSIDVLTMITEKSYVKSYNHGGGTLF